MNGADYLAGTVKYYDWGGFSYVPSLLNTSNDVKKPFAEYWMGIHPLAQCRVGDEEDGILLRELLNSHGRELLGQYVYERFGNMPFLLKVLDVRNMLSIQVHPSKKQAEEDFARENKAGIPLDSPQRNYKDDNHKPELMVAIGEFWLLHGFRPEAGIKQILQSVPELNSLLPVFEQTGYRGLYARVMEMEQQQVNDQLDSLLERIIPLYQAGKLEKTNPDYWAAKGTLTFSQPGKTDRGIFSVYFFNLVNLQRGQAIFQDAGLPHAYLEGQNVEIMANSDNVLRGGLTTKHIDVKELLKHVKCEATYPRILEGELVGDEKIYKTPAPDFELGAFSLQKDQHSSFTPVTTEVLLLLEGEVRVRTEKGEIILKKGQPSGIVFPGHTVELTALASSWLFRATIALPGVDKMR